MQETCSDRDSDGNSDLDNEVNELMYDMMMKVSCIMFIIASSTNVLTILYLKFSDKISSFQTTSLVKHNSENMHGNKIVKACTTVLDLFNYFPFKHFLQ